MAELQQTVFHDRHVALGAKMVEFVGWDMPIFYPTGIVQEHLATRKGAGLFDVSHMGRFIVRGKGALRFLQHVLSNNAEALDIRVTGSQYTFIPTETGGAVDDAYLYRFVANEYQLVVNAANLDKDWDHLQTLLKDFDDVDLTDRSNEIAMLAVQGPMSRHLMEEIIDSGQLPEPVRNSVSIATISGAEVKVARTGYTGEPLCFELFVGREDGPKLWDKLVEKGATPIGLGARDTLRLEAGLPLYGHELGDDPDGKEIPIMSCPLSKFAVSFSPLKKDFYGSAALRKQQEAFKKILSRDYSLIHNLPRITKSIAVSGRGIARDGARVFKGEKHVGYVTSGTMVPTWTVEGEGLKSAQTDEHQLRSICFGYIDSDIIEGDEITIDIRGKSVDALVVPFHMRTDAPPYSRPIIYDHRLEDKEIPRGDSPAKVRRLLEKTIENTIWRQHECINLIPSEMTMSPLVRLLSVMDPAFRYAEHKKSKAFYDADIFYYQGTEFIGQVELMLEQEIREFLCCEYVETRLISGQMANTAVFSAMVDYINRGDRKREPRRIRQVMNNHIGKGGHLSAQPMGALKDYVARDPRTERPAVVNFPVLVENPFKMDVPATLKLIDEYRPEFIIFGKSMVLHKEPVTEIRRFLDAQGIDAVMMYDMAHVLGLIGPHFQEPFAEGADLVTGSTHKTFFGTQRGVVGSRFQEHEERYELWEALERRAFPGSVSNHHPGTLLGLLMAAYEMNHFKGEYQPKVIANAKAFARALSDSGLNVAGDPAIDFTETHQVVVDVGYGSGPEIAGRLEANNIICNYQASTDEESFTASGALRMGVSEMTRFGMEEADFRALAGLIHDVVTNHSNVIDKVKALRERFLDLRFCFKIDEYTDLHRKLHDLL
ncbi:MAG: glycine cleavage system aminomethyltransferase GcvT [Deltaproteobacteria bacterium]|nr:glycine cleavage system aminomethyltransferase GcvT [Deltaproteobacteria bacterium]MBW2343435.1 glycine cleavage system aminomethyltransferase GcvT [Deltaproteobacteria bacterium]